MVKYFYDVKISMGRTTSDMENYAQSWSKINSSGSTPKQTNNYDCGVFTLINLALLAHGHTLSTTIFAQGRIYNNQSRRS